MQDNKHLKNKNFIEAWKKAFAGILYAIKSQRNVKIQLVIAIIVIISGIIIKFTITEWIAIIIVTMLVIITEVINTAIEETVNLCTKEYHPIAKIAKDTSAGAVVLAALTAVIVAILILIGRLM